MTPPSFQVQPIFACDPHVIDPSGAIAVWWTEPPGAVLQLIRPTRGTTAMAEWLVGPGLELIAQRFPGRTDLRLILDMRPMTGRSATARSMLIQCGKGMRGRLEHVVLVPSLQLGAAYVKIVEAAALVLRLAGLNVEVEHALDRVLRTHGVRAAQELLRVPSADRLTPARATQVEPTRNP